MPKIKLISPTQIDFPQITIFGDVIDIKIDNRPDGNLIIWTKNNVQQVLSCYIFSTNYNAQSIDILYDSVVVDDQLNIISRISAINTTDPNKINTLNWNSFYEFITLDSLGVALSKFIINEAFFDKWNYKCFNINGEFQQPITSTNLVTNETATYEIYYSDRLNGTNGNSNLPDEVNQDGKINITQIDGGVVSSFKITDSDGISITQTNGDFSNLSGSEYTIELVGLNIVGPGNVTSISVDTVLKPLLFEVQSAVDFINDTVTLNIFNVTNSVGLVEYKIDNGDFQTDSNFSELSYGTHSLTIKDDNNTTAIKQLEL